MKKIASILLLAILLFNCCGYRWMFNAMQQRADMKLESALDKNEYDESQLVEIRMTIDLPYQTDWAGFERFDGEVEMNGVHYKYVKRKIQNGQLILLCIPNHSKQKFESAKEDIFKTNNDLWQNSAAKKSGNSSPAPLKNVLSDFDNLQQLCIITSNANSSQIRYSKYQLARIAAIHSRVPDRPPIV